MNYAKHFSVSQTPQTEQADPSQVQNSAGGYAFEITPWQRLARFLILGCEGGTYYATERKITQDNAKCVQECLALDPARTVEVIADLSETGRAPKNDPAVFALAIAASTPGPAASAALAALPRVCRISTDLFHFVAACKGQRGWGSGLRRAVSDWYTRLAERDLCYQIAKYQQRDGWSHRDVLRLSHAEINQPVARYIVSGADGMGLRTVERKGRQTRTYPELILPEYLEAFEELKHADARRTQELILRYDFTHEMIDSRHKNNPDVWACLLQHMPMRAMVRNLGKMTEVGLLAPLSAATNSVVARLVNEASVQRSRLHPLALLSAERVYAQGHGERGSLRWSPVGAITDALDEAFYLAFGGVESTGKRTLVAVDVSGSMDSGTIAGVPGISPHVGAAALAMVALRTEPNTHVVAFSSGVPGEYRYGSGASYWGVRCPAGLSELGISARQRLDDVISTMAKVPMGGTDCALPMLYAMARGLEVDLFQIITDNETWAGGVHPHQALAAYRNKSGIPAKLAVIGMTATSFSIADPNDAGQMDFVGFDLSTPQAIAQFAKMC